MADPRNGGPKSFALEFTTAGRNDSESELNDAGTMAECGQYGRVFS